MHSHLHLFLFQRCLLLQILAPNLHSHLHVSCYAMCLVSLVLDIWLNTLTFKFLTTLGTPNFAHGLLILLQLPLDLLVLILKGKNTGSSLLTLTIFGLTLHYWLFFEIQLNKFTFLKVDTDANPVKNNFFVSLSILQYVICSHQTLVNV